MIEKGILVLLLLFATPLLGARIASTSPELTELIFQIGKGEDLVATSQGSDFPDSAKHLPSIGPLYMPSIERTLVLTPDWVLVDTKNLNTHFVRSLNTQKFRYLEIDLSNIKKLFSSSKKILQSLYQEDTTPQLDKFHKCVKNISPSQPFSYLAFVWLSPTILFGHTSFLSDVLSRVGGVNAIPQSWKIEFPRVTDEWLIMQKVDALFFVADDPKAKKEITRFSKKWWPNRSVRLQILSSKNFARASFTPLMHIDELSVINPKTRFQECVEKPN